MRQNKKFFAKQDKIPQTMANASKQPWECQSYAEWFASLPLEEQQAAEAGALEMDEEITIFE